MSYNYSTMRDRDLHITTFGLEMDYVEHNVVRKRKANSMLYN